MKPEIRNLCVAALRKHCFNVWADRVENGTHPLDAVKALAEYTNNQQAVIDVCVAMSEPASIAPLTWEQAAGGSGTVFWMVYREGGRPPAFKHIDEDAAVAEAKRIANESGDVTHVLVATKTIHPNARPTLAEFARHAEIHGPGNGIGLWRVVDGVFLFPEIIPVRVDHGDVWRASNANNVNLHRLGECKDVKWFPLDATGKDIEEPIPF